MDGKARCKLQSAVQKLPNYSYERRVSFSFQGRDTSICALINHKKASLLSLLLASPSLACELLRPTQWVLLMEILAIAVCDQFTPVSEPGPRRPLSAPA